MRGRLRELLFGRAFAKAPEGYAYACQAREIAGGRAVPVAIGAYEVAVFGLSNGEVCAIESKCPHAMGPLEERCLDGEVVECPWHGLRFSVRTGISPDGRARVPTFGVVVKEGRVYVSKEPSVDYQDFPTPPHEQLARIGRRG